MNLGGDTVHLSTGSFPKQMPGEGDNWSHSPPQVSRFKIDSWNFSQLNKKLDQLGHTTDGIGKPTLPCLSFLIVRGMILPVPACVRVVMDMKMSTSKNNMSSVMWLPSVVFMAVSPGRELVMGVGHKM